jgi:uroporphyrinogen-III synthase
MKQILLMIRPLRQAKEFVADLGTVADAFDVFFDPIIQINFLPIDLPAPQERVFVFTSANAVAAYARQHTVQKIRAFCINEATATAAGKAGFDTVAGTTDAAGLVDLIDADHVTYIRARDVSFDLTNALSRKGVGCEEFVAYAQSSLRLSMDSLHAIETRHVVLPVLSNIAAESLIGQIDPTEAHNLTVVCISSKVSNHFKTAGFSSIIEAATPNRAGLLACLAEIGSGCG